MALHHIFFLHWRGTLKGPLSRFTSHRGIQEGTFVWFFQTATFLIFLLPTIFGRSIWSNCFFLVILCVIVYIAGGGFTHLLIYHYPITPSPLPLSLKVLSHCIADYTWSISTRLYPSVHLLQFSLSFSIFLFPFTLSISLSLSLSPLICTASPYIALRLYLIVKAEPFIGC